MGGTSYFRGAYPAPGAVLLWILRAFPKRPSTPGSGATLDPVQLKGPCCQGGPGKLTWQGELANISIGFVSAFEQHLRCPSWGICCLQPRRCQTQFQLKKKVFRTMSRTLDLFLDCCL